MKKITLFTFVAVAAMAFIGCSTTDSTNGNVRVNGTTVNSNTAIVVNANTMPVTNTNATTTGNSNNWNAGITREEYDRNKEDYANRAKSAGSTIGSGVNDGWLWTKTRAALATTDELRESTINVDVDNAVVTLKGTVANAAQKAKAESVAKGIQGVSSVKNQLTVSAGDSLTNRVTGDGGNTKSTTTNANTKH